MQTYISLSAFKENKNINIVFMHIIDIINNIVFPNIQYDRSLKSLL